MLARFHVGKVNLIRHPASPFPLVFDEDITVRNLPDLETTVDSLKVVTGFDPFHFKSVLIEVVFDMRKFFIRSLA